MTLPPLYKYLNVSGAKLTLGNGAFKHAEPSDFNDKEDLTIQSVFAEDIEETLRKIMHGFREVILRHIDDEPTCGSPMKEKLKAIQRVYRTNPKMTELIQAQQMQVGVDKVYDLESLRRYTKAFIADINEFMQGYRVLCVTTHKDSERMWTEYADQHKGIALRIEPNLAKDSKFQLFRPVQYRERRPPLYEDELEFSANALFGDHEAERKEIMERVIYSKTLDWQHESEYRLVIPVRQHEKPWDTLPYHPEEITELYIGLNMEPSDVEDIVSKGCTINPDIAIFRAKRLDGGNLIFEQR